MNIAICDDEKIFCCELNDLLLQYAHDRMLHISVTAFESGNELLLSEEKFDIVFMDYKMNGYNGIQTAEQMRRLGRNETVIFLSAYGEVVYDTFAVNTFRFLLKPLDTDKLFKALDDYFDTVKPDDALFIKLGDKSWKINCSDIIYAEADRKHTIIRTSERIFEIPRCLSEIEAMLPKDKFIRTHRSYVVGFSHIINHSRETILLDNGEKSNIGRTYYSDFKKSFLEYIKRHNHGNSLS